MKRLTKGRRKIQYFAAWYNRLDYNDKLLFIISVSAFLFGTSMMVIGK